MLWQFRTGPVFIYICRIENRIQIPIEIVHLGDGGYHLFCEIRIHDKPIRALIDTGANKSVLSELLADQLEDLEPFESDENQTAGIGKEQVETRFVIAGGIQIGTLLLPAQIVGLIDLEHVDEMYRQMEIEPFEMIIGGDVLMDYQAVIDYGKSALFLIEGLKD